MPAIDRSLSDCRAAGIGDELVKVRNDDFPLKNDDFLLNKGFLY